MAILNATTPLSDKIGLNSETSKSTANISVSHQDSGMFCSDMPVITQQSAHLCWHAGANPSLCDQEFFQINNSSTFTTSTPPSVQYYVYTHSANHCAPGPLEPGSYLQHLPESACRRPRQPFPLRSSLISSKRLHMERRLVRDLRSLFLEGRLRWRRRWLGER